MKKKINILGLHSEGMMICRINSTAKKVIVIEPLTKEQEDDIDKSKKYYGDIRFINKNDKTIEAKDIYLYGEINFDNEEDLYHIEQFNLINNDGAWIYTNVDYDTGDVYSINNSFKTSQIYNPIEWFKYCHLLIGKPNRVIVYKKPN